MSEKTFVEGLFIKARREKTPEFVMLEAGIKVDEFKAFLDKHADNNFVNIRVLTSKSGKPYAELDTWKPEGTRQAQPHQQPSTPDAEVSNTNDQNDLPF